MVPWRDYHRKGCMTPLDTQFSCNFLLEPDYSEAPLPAAISHKLEDFFWADLGSVYFAEGPEPAWLGAVAFAYGERVFLGPGYTPDCPTGLSVLVHELTHVLQQRAGLVSAENGQVAVVRDRQLEAEARRAAAAWTAGACEFGSAAWVVSPVSVAPVVQCLTFHGQVSAPGQPVKFGVLNVTQLQAWIDNKSNRLMNPGSVSQCASYVQGHPGAGGGGAFGNFTWKGSQVYHISHGQMGSNQGCTVFFAESSPGIATICAIAYHRDDNGPHGAPRYLLDWVKDNWVTTPHISP